MKSINKQDVLEILKTAVSIAIGVYLNQGQSKEVELWLKSACELLENEVEDLSLLDTNDVYQALTSFYCDYSLLRYDSVVEKNIEYHWNVLTAMIKQVKGKLTEENNGCLIAARISH